MLNLCYIYYISKLTEFADTTFFVMRKKKSQITWLHVYHHSLTPIEAWILVKFLAGKWQLTWFFFFNLSNLYFYLYLVSLGGNATFPNLLNNFVHICMYFYYMMSAMGPEYAKYLWWKKYMTELQIVSIFFTKQYEWKFEKLATLISEIKAKFVDAIIIVYSVYQEAPPSDIMWNVLLLHFYGDRWCDSSMRDTTCVRTITRLDVLYAVVLK